MNNFFKKYFIILVVLIILINIFRVEKNVISDFKSSIFKLVLLDLESTRHATATGFVVANKKNKSYILTNDHFCSSMEIGMFFMSSDNEFYEFEDMLIFEKRDEKKDLCLLSSSRDLRPLKIVKKNELRLSQELWLIGAPQGAYPHISKIYISEERMSELNIAKQFPEIYVKRMILVSGKIHFGHSGSPILDKQGRVRGIMFAKSLDLLGYAVSSEDILEFIHGL
jgi:S1-C subfamily serine protease